MLQLSRAFSGLSVDNLDKARTFYGDVLGLKVKSNPMDLLELDTEDNSPIIIYPKFNHTPATFTVLNFPVDDIEEAVGELSERGISFEKYTGSISTDEKGICRSEHGPDIAWIRDPAGNILSVLAE